ncbi:MAG: hypothetical protein JOZ39_10290 [Chloroflexi bacterium]|nr:hypothetical protein [Chloroflexota bacterium]
MKAPPVAGGAFVLALVTLAGAFFRLFDIWQYPVGFHFDEAADLIDVARLGAAYHPIYFAANNGREPLFLYWAAVFVSGLGFDVHALRLAAAFVGVLTIPAVYFCFAQVLREAEGARRARTIGLFAAAVCACLFMHVNFSRIGLRTISLPLVECLAFGVLWLAFRRGGWWRSVLAGFTFAACFYTYTTARLLAPCLVAYGVFLAGWRWQTGRRAVRRWLAGAGIFAVAFLAAVAPLTWYAVTNPGSFLQRTEGLALSDRSEILRNVLAMLELPVVRGSVNGAHNVIGMALFDWPMRIAFVVGLALLLTRLRRPEYVFVILWGGCVALASVFSPDAPYYIRLTALVPPAAMIPALALAELPAWLSHLRWPRAAALAPSILAILTSAGLTYRSYFQVWGPSNDTYFWMMQDKVDAAAFLRQAVSDGSRVFLAPLYDQDYTFQAADRGQPIQSFDPAQCWTLPPAGTRGLYAFPPYDAVQPGLLLAHLPPTATERPVINGLKQPVLIALDLPAAPVGTPATPLAVFGGQIALLRIEGLASAPLAPGASLPLTLVWQPTKQPTGDYTGFVHGDDAAHHLRVQQDHAPCGGSLPTYSWQPGEQIFDRYVLTVAMDAPAGEYALTAGLYQLPEARNLTVDGGQSELAIGSFKVGS